MGKDSFVSKLTGKFLNSSKADTAYKEEWENYVKSFGAWMDSAFAANDIARKHLTEALGRTGRGDVVQALKELERLRKECRTDADKAAWLFFVGFTYKQGGDQDRAAEYWMEAAAYAQPFYIIYLKLAEAAYEDRLFEVSEDFCKKTLNALKKIPAGAQGQNREAEALTYKTLAGCLTMMHRYRDAEKILKKANDMLTQEESAAAWAVLYAVHGGNDKTAEKLAILKETAPDLYLKTEKLTARILSGEDAHFCRILPKEELIVLFWEWFAVHEADMVTMLVGEHPEKVIEMIQEKLNPVFPFMEQDIEIGIRIQNAQCILEVADYYAASIHAGLDQLLKAQPEELKTHWKWNVVHY